MSNPAGAGADADGPEWLDWPLRLTPHLLKRMLDRGFNEADLRVMLENADDPVPDHEPGRWLVRARLGCDVWSVIVEPDPVAERLDVVTAFRTG